MLSIYIYINCSVIFENLIFFNHHTRVKSFFIRSRQFVTERLKVLSARLIDLLLSLHFFYHSSVTIRIEKAKRRKAGKKPRIDVAEEKIAVNGPLKDLPSFAFGLGYRRPLS